MQLSNLKHGGNVYVNAKKLSCAGVEGPLGHPKVYLDMGDDNQIVCPYCSKQFILK